MYYAVCVCLGISISAEIHWYFVIGILIVLIVLFLQILKVEEKDPPKDSFSTPWNPYMPCIGMIANCALAGGVPIYAWISYGIWICCGAGVYFFYGYWNSKMRYRFEQGKANADLIS